MRQFKVHLKCGANLSKIKDSNGFGRVYTSLMKWTNGEDGVSLVDSKKDADLQVCLCFPFDRWDSFHWYGRGRHENSVIYTTWETTRPPDNWIEVINTFKALMVPSRWNAEVFKQCGVEVPIHVVPHGVDIEKFKYVERDWDSELFVFLWQGMQMSDRKGAYYAEKAFELADLPNAILVEKIYPCVSKEFQTVQIGKRIQIRSIMPFDEYIGLLAKCHVSVNPFRGEGFALMPLECAATGMATMLTGWSGATEYANEDFWNIRYELCKPGQDYINSSPWVDLETAPAQDAIPDIEDIASGMKFFYHNRHEAKTYGECASQHAQKFTWKNAAKIFSETCLKIV